MPSFSAECAKAQLRADAGNVLQQTANPSSHKADCAFGKGMQLEARVEIKEWEGPLHTAAAFLSAVPYTSGSFGQRISHL